MILRLVLKVQIVVKVDPLTVTIEIEDPFGGVNDYTQRLSIALV